MAISIDGPLGAAALEIAYRINNQVPASKSQFENRTPEQVFEQLQGNALAVAR